MAHRRFFQEYDDMYFYVCENHIKNWDYKFTFHYGYELIVKEEEENDD